MNRIFIIYILSVLFGCNNDQTEQALINYSSREIIEMDSLQIVFYGTPELLKETDLKTIYNSFNEINLIENWDSITEREVIAAEGGSLQLFYLKDKITKAFKVEMGETYNSETIFYFNNTILSFMYQRQIKYNRPIYWDSAQMKEMGDSEIFDISKFDTVYIRGYFNEEGILIKQNNSVNFNEYFDSSYIVDETQQLKNLIDYKTK